MEFGLSSSRTSEGAARDRPADSRPRAVVGGYARILLRAAKASRARFVERQVRQPVGAVVLRARDVSDAPLRESREQHARLPVERDQARVLDPILAADL